jgi:dihydrofolate synthase / folylpolyglutamate synthase
VTGAQKNHMKIESFKDIEKLLRSSILSLTAEESYNLGRIKLLMDQLDNPQNKVKVVHIAGTSGKTSTAYYIAEMLRLNGYKTGLSASPHIEEMNERLQINLVPLNEEEFCNELTEFLEILNGLSIKPTYFELFTAFAFWYFYKAKVDYAVMETGLGGLLDATNIVSRADKICIITDIGSDHTEILGKTLEEITAQKSGIIQPKNVVFMNRQPDKVIKPIEKVVKKQLAELHIVDKIKENKDLPMLQKRNWTLAKKSAAYIFDRENAKNLLEKKYILASKIIIPGRYEKYYIFGKEIILDGAHNQQKMQALIDSLSYEIGDQKICVILAVGQNKKAHLLQMSRLTSSIASQMILTSFDEEQDFKQKSLSPEYIAEYIETNIPFKIITDVNKAIAVGLESDADKILITGSLYLAGKVRKYLSSHR